MNTSSVTILLTREIKKNPLLLTYPPILNLSSHAMKGTELEYRREKVILKEDCDYIHLEGRTTPF
jgi:hypothetical protein